MMSPRLIRWERYPPARGREVHAGAWYLKALDARSALSGTRESGVRGRREVPAGAWHLKALGAWLVLKTVHSLAKCVPVWG